MPIGNFTKPSTVTQSAEGTTIQSAAPAAPTPHKTIANAVESGLTQDVAANAPVVERAKTYEERLAEEGLTLSKAYSIRDALLIDGFYEEDIVITPNTSVTFRTRRYVDFVRLQRAIGIARPTFEAEREEMQLRYMLASSLVRYRDVPLEHAGEKATAVEIDEAFNKRHEYVLTLPEMVVRILAEKLNVFDRKVLVATSEGSVESF